MTQDVTLVIGVPGSGKSWVCEQLADRFRYIRNDDHKYDLAEAIAVAASSEVVKPILSDVPFGERKLRDRLLALGLRVRPVFILEKEEEVKARYAKRGVGEAPDAIIHRISGLSNRAIAWNAFGGTSREVLEFLRWVD